VDVEAHSNFASSRIGLIAQGKSELSLAESWEYEGPSTNLAAPAKDQSMNVYK
jgi:hypothetical protein